MRTKSAAYKRITASDHWFEVSLVVGEGTPDKGYRESSLAELTTDRPVFANDSLELGCCVSGEITAKLLLPSTEIPRMAKLRPYVRATNGKEHSEWLQKGQFFIDSREIDDTGDKVKWITLRGFDAMLFAEADCPGITGTDSAIVTAIAQNIGVTVEAGTVVKLSGSYIGSVANNEYSMREILGFIASAYSGCFIMNDEAELQLIQLNDLP